MKKLFKILFVLFWLTLCVLAFYFTYSFLWAPHIHAYGEWSVTAPAACTAEGQETRTCECGATDTRPIPATGHQPGEWQTVREVSWTEDGERQKVCKTCKEVTVTEAVPLTLSEGLEYTLTADKKSYTVTGIGTCTDEVVVIPAEYNGLPVTGIGGYVFRGSICKAAKEIAKEVGAKAIIVESATGRVARAMVHYRPEVPVIAVVTSERVCRKLSLNWGVTALVGEEKLNSDDITTPAMEKALGTGLVKRGDTVVVLSSNKTVPTSSTDSLNIRIL